MAALHRVSLDQVVAHFQQLEDPRSTINQRHPLVSVLVIALLAVLAGAGGPTAIARWAALKQEFLLEVLDLPNGIPRKDVFRRVLMALKPAAFQACFAGWLQSLRTEAAAETGIEQPILAVDLTFRRWRRRFPAIFRGSLVRGVGARSLGPGHRSTEASRPMPRGLTGTWLPRSTGPAHTG